MNFVSMCAPAIESALWRVQHKFGALARLGERFSASGSPARAVATGAREVRRKQPSAPDKVAARKMPPQIPRVTHIALTQFVFFWQIGLRKRFLAPLRQPSGARSNAHNPLIALPN